MAERLFEAGSFSEAAQAFYQLGGYGDSASRYDDARCAVAVQTYLDGRESAARHLLLDIENPHAHIAAAALAVGGSEAEAQRIMATEAFSPAALQQMERDVAALSAAREAAVYGRVAAGDRHTVAVRSDGTVLAAGSNAQGQCDVGGWTDITQVAAGAWHTVGLRRDGTVVAAGADAYGQCDVGDWTDITAVAAMAYGTLGLRADGTVVATRMYAEKVSGWRGVTRITGGSYSAGCLYGHGSMMCMHKGAQIDMAAALSDLSVCGAVSAGILADGSLISSYEGAPDWTGLRSVTAGQTALIGITLEGGVLVYPYREGQAQALSVEGTPVEAAGGGTHIAVLTREGRVFAFGENGDGQCDTAGWQL